MNPRKIQAKHWKIVPKALFAMTDRQGSDILILGNLKTPTAREVWEQGVRVRQVKLIVDLAAEYVIEDHFAEGYRIVNTVFSEEALSRDWDVVLIESKLDEVNTIGESANEILNASQTAIWTKEVWLVTPAT